MQDACACGLYVRFLWIVRARECAIFLVNKVFVQVENANFFPARASRRSQKFSVTLGGGAENGELAVGEMYKSKKYKQVYCQILELAYRQKPPQIVRSRKKGRSK